MENVTWLSTGPSKVFATTRWSVIAACSHADQAKAAEALSELCQSYWQPIYACIRHHGHPLHDAQDLTQEFFVHLLKGKWLNKLDVEKGRFRSYLSVAVRNFLIGYHRRRWTLWRNRSIAVVSFDVVKAENRYQHNLAIQDSPEALYERQWAATVIEHSLNQLLVEMRTDGREVLFGHFDAILAARPRGLHTKKLRNRLG